MLHWPRYVKWVPFELKGAGNACPISCLEREPEILGEQHSWLLFSVSSQELGFSSAATAAAKSLQSCRTLCDPIDGSPPGSPIPGILQVRKLEWVAISLSEVTQSCPTLSNPMDCSLPGSSVHGIFQARVLEWVAIAFSRDLVLGVNKLLGGKEQLGIICGINCGPLMLLLFSDHLATISSNICVCVHTHTHTHTHTW